MGKGLIATLLALTVLAGPASSLNWEGHEDFFMEQMAVPEFTAGVPKPLKKPLPACEELRAKAKDNSYEQIPIVGKNCIEADITLPEKSPQQ
jgi:hypothetical protein